MTLSYFVYYRVAPGAATEVAGAVAKMQARLKEESGVGGRLLRRADESSTWMEAYEAVRDIHAFELLLDRLVLDCGVDRLLAQGETRHIERFVPCA